MKKIIKNSKNSALEIMKNDNRIPRELISILDSDKSLIFYGCGNQGSICEDILSCNMKFKVDGFAVSDGQNKYTKWESKIPVFSISELDSIKEECGILITLGSDGREVRENLINKGYKHVCKIDNWEEANDALREISLKCLFLRHHIKISNDDKCFVYQNFKFINPLRENQMVKTMFFREFENITAKNVFEENKDDQVDSSYESEHVALKKGDIVFDCGANIGIFSAMAASVGCDVYAFEPVKFIENYTKKTAALYDGNFKVINKALSDSTGEVQFLEVNDNNNYNSDSSRIIASDDYNANDVYHLTKVSSSTIDEFVKENNIGHVDFIKADIEGAERLMLSGAKKTLAEMSPKLSICTYHLPDDREVLTNIILEANANYKIDYTWDKLYAYVPIK